MIDQTQYLSGDKLAALSSQLRELREHKIPAIAKRIDEARQMGDLSENAEYHASREEMAWAQSRAKELEHIIDNAEIIAEPQARGKVKNGTVQIGSTISVVVNTKTKKFTIVGAQEADPSSGKISNESPLGQAFLGKEKNDIIAVEVPAGKQTYKIIEIE